MPTISLALGERSYDIHVENGALDRTGEFTYRGYHGQLRRPTLCRARNEVPGERGIHAQPARSECRGSFQKYASGPGAVFRTGPGRA